MIHDLRFELAAADTYSDWAKVPFKLLHFWRILQARGVVTFQLAEDGAERARVAGQWGITHPDEPIARVRVKSTVAETVLFTVGNERESDQPGRLGGGSALGVISPANAYVYDNLGLAAGAIGMLDVAPIGKELVAAYISLDYTAPGPIYVLPTAMGGVQGLQIMPGTTSPALRVIHGPTGGSHNGINVYNPNAVAVSCYSYGEYIN